MFEGKSSGLLATSPRAALTTKVSAPESKKLPLDQQVPASTGEKKIRALECVSMTCGFRATHRRQWCCRESPLSRPVPSPSRGESGRIFHSDNRHSADIASCSRKEPRQAGHRSGG